MECRPGCAACCIVISISSPLPGMPQGKPAGVPCPHLTAERRCSLFGKAERPAVCSNLQPDRDMCGDTDEEAFSILSDWEEATKPQSDRLSIYDG
ncbi:YkgJ family cysteine cluster protein [Paenibacillus senegalensis]|uniref:YkgJ family cysteine cluster protein n=1 Tax=Paenibacillus senegalensis TaxID=1465766 RepID=UPI000288F38D|nr:YkgJ family cysteine cluster protein [Paenibacillus senegalensis]